MPASYVFNGDSPFHLQRPGDPKLCGSLPPPPRHRLSGRVGPVSRRAARRPLPYRRAGQGALSYTGTYTEYMQTSLIDLFEVIMC